MTIIEPNKNKFKLSLDSILIFFLFLIVVSANIYLYNKIVNLDYSLSRREKSLQELQLANADLKNNLYKITDFEDLNVVAEQRRLVKVNNPEYLETDQSWAFALQF